MDFKLASPRLGLIEYPSGLKIVDKGPVLLFIGDALVAYSHRQVVGDAAVSRIAG